MSKKRKSARKDGAAKLRSAAGPKSYQENSAEPNGIISTSARLICAGTVFGAALLLYARTLAPTVTLVDSGELIVAARFCGVAHPPGFPLWVMLAHLASLVPFANVAQRINFSSAIFAAFACGVVTQIVTEVLLILGSRSQKQPQTLFPVVGPALICGLLTACSRTLWSYATVAEVYALNSLLIALVIFLMLRWRRAIDKGDTAFGDLWLYLAAFIFGLGLGVHHVTVALVLPSLALLVYRTCGRSFFGSKKLLIAGLLSGAAMVATYAYLPIAAAQLPILNWGNPRTLTEIWWHLSGRQYQAFFSFAPQVIGRGLGGFAMLLSREFGPIWLPLALAFALAGFRLAWQRDRSLFYFLTLLIAVNLLYGLCYEISEDKDAYYLPTVLVLVMAVGLGVRWLLEWTSANTRQRLVGATVALMLPALTLAGNWRFADRSRYFIASDYVDNILGTIASEGLLLTLDWQVASPMFYTREVEQRRRDVSVIDMNLLRRSWYFDYLKQAYPELISRSQREIDAYVSELKRWERDPKAYAASAALSEQIDSAFRKMWQALLTNESRIRPIYVTSELASIAGGDNEELTRWLVTRHRLVPRGLVFQVSENPELTDPGDLHLETRGLADGTLAFEKDDVVKVKVLPAYTNMLITRGRYLALLNQHERASAAFEQALTLDPSLLVARKGLSESLRIQENR